MTNKKIPSEKASKFDKKLLKWLWILIIILFIPIVIDLIKEISDDTSKTVDKYDAEVFAKKFVKEELKSPSSAKFPGTREKIIKEIEDNIWEVSGWVEAENSFGATTKSNFNVVMEYHPNDEGWTLESIDIN